MAPLAAFQGAKPPAPDWFTRALANAPERSFLEVDGAKIETLAWGRRGAPGLILLHGGMAHADWWSFIAPFLATELRVVAPSFSGMGRSDWRAHYDFPTFAREAVEIGRLAGAFEAGPPIVVGHSFGSRVAAVGWLSVRRGSLGRRDCRSAVLRARQSPATGAAADQQRPSRARFARGARRALSPFARTGLRTPVHSRPYRPQLRARGR